MTFGIRQLSQDAQKTFGIVYAQFSVDCIAVVLNGFEREIESLGNGAVDQSLTEHCCQLFFAYRKSAQNLSERLLIESAQTMQANMP